MPSVIVLENCVGPSKEEFQEIGFLIKEDFPESVVEIVQQRVRLYKKLHEDYSRDDLIAIAEGTIAEYGGTLIPFALYLVSC